MELQAQFCLFGLAFFLFYCSPCKPKQLTGYKFSVYTTDMCPRDKTEWDKRSSAINCTKNNGYICIPNENRTALLEFCYIYQTTWISKGVCLYLIKRYSRVDSYKCNKFAYGCPDIAYKATQLIHYKSCTSIGNGCFLAEPLCKKEWKDNTTDYEQTTQHKDIEIYPVEDNTMEVLLVTVISIMLILILIIVYVCCRRRKCSKSVGDEENVNPKDTNDKAVPLLDNSYNQQNTVAEEDMAVPLLDNLHNQQNTVTEEDMVLRFEIAVLHQWREDETFFFPTRACKEVEKKIKNQNLVIVTGHSGSGKSAIIQHIALKYKDQGWIVKSLTGVMEMRKYILNQERYLNSTILVLNDPIGKDSFDKASYLLWEKSEQTILTFFKKGKLLISCRNYILFDNKVKGDLKEKTNIVNIADAECKLTHEEKRCIWNKYMSNEKISEEDFTDIFNIEAYFPLLCKLFSCDMKYQIYGYRFFKEPVKVIEEQIRCFRKEDRGKYCALVLLVLFNNNFCSDDAVRNELLSYSFKGALKMCELSHDIGDNLDLLKGLFVKKIGDAYEFYHDFVMEVTSFLLGKDHPAELIQYADIRFLLRRVTLDNGIEQNRPFTIYLNDVRNIDILGERFFNALFEECYLEVILHPALRDKRFIKVLQKEFERHPEKLQELLRTKKSIYDDHKLYWPITDDCMAKLGLVALENKFSPFCALMAFCDTDLISHCFQAFRQLETDLIGINIVTAVCCNGSKDFFKMLANDYIKDSLTETFGDLFPIHIAALLYNFEILEELIHLGAEVNVKTKDEKSWTPLMFAASRYETDPQDNKYNMETSIRRDQTVQMLIDNTADVNLCAGDGVSSLYLACQNGHTSMVKILLSNGAYVNQCTRNGESPLYKACHERHNDIVQLLLEKGADINLRTADDEASPLYIACKYGHDSIVQTLVDHGADLNVCTSSGVSPLFKACQKGYNISVQLLIDKGAVFNMCMYNGASPLYIACENDHISTVKLLLSNKADANLGRKDKTSPLVIACQNGNENLVQLLLDNGADINICDEDGASPLLKACQKGYIKIVQLLLTNGANINLCTLGFSPLVKACQNGHDETVRTLLKHGADVNLCTSSGASPLFIACQKGYNISVQLLIDKGAVFNMCMYNGASPLYIACENDHISTVKLLLSNKADANLGRKDKISPLFFACHNGNKNLVQLLLDYGADINICDEDGASPLLMACHKGYNNIVQLLLTTGANINLCTFNLGFSPLVMACEKGHEETVRTLLKHGAKVNLCTSSRISPLFIACQKGYNISVQLLIDEGAVVNMCKDNGVSPLYIACKNGHISTVKLLLSNKADVNLCRKDKTSPLFIACQNGNENLVQLLLDNGANINICDEDGASPLLIACQKGYNKIVQLLLTTGANINLCTLEGFSPLVIACENGHKETVRTLLENRANINIRTIKGTAEDIARQNGNEMIVQMLKKQHCKNN
nr:ankyrin-1 isoform X1 [Crassostrea gigas]